MKRAIALLLLFIFVVGVMAACEQPPGEVSGMVKYSDGRPASVKIRFFAGGKQVYEASSSMDGTYYSGKNLPPGDYTVKYFKGEEELTGTPNTVSVDADGSTVLNVTLT